MHVIVLASQKGGSGKTTLTGNLAIAAELARNGPAVLIDTDPQGSLAAWWNVRKAESPAFASATVAELKRKLDDLEAAGYLLAFVDTPPAIAQAISAVIAQADLVLIPTRPSPHDLRAVGSTVAACAGAGQAVRICRDPGETEYPLNGPGYGRACQRMEPSHPPLSMTGLTMPLR